MKTKRRDILRTLFIGLAGIASMGFSNRTKEKIFHSIRRSANEKSVYPDEPTKFTKLGNVVFASGFVCLPDEGPRTLENHTKVAMGKLEAALKEAGSGLDKVYRITAWIDDIENYYALSKPYAEAFPGGRRFGNRSCMAVNPGTLPGSSMVAFDAIAHT